MCVGCDDDQCSAIGSCALPNHAWSSEACDCVPIGGAGVVDATPTGPLSCQQADQAFAEARINDSKLRELAACTRDDQCALWSPTLTCAGRQRLLDCAQATTNVAAAVARGAELAVPLCARIPADCNIGVSCMPMPQARCVEGGCRITAQPL